jgi:hypothetical protein
MMMMIQKTHESCWKRCSLDLWKLFNDRETQSGMLNNIGVGRLCLSFIDECARRPCSF